jgi:hypothetical protein
MRLGLLVLLLSVTTVAQARPIEQRASTAHEALQAPCGVSQARLKGAPTACMLDAIKTVLTRMERRHQRWLEEQGLVGWEWE